MDGGWFNGFIQLNRLPAKRKVQCLAIYTILLALNQTVVDFFSLDIEGSELDILRTIPFDKVTIKTLLVEDFHIPEGAKVLREFMEGKGYTLYAKIAWDSIFVLTSILESMAIQPLPSARVQPTTTTINK
jgi:Methyltransferase FkbM domain